MKINCLACPEGAGGEERAEKMESGILGPGEGEAEGRASGCLSCSARKPTRLQLVGWKQARTAASRHIVG